MTITRSTTRTTARTGLALLAATGVLAVAPSGASAARGGDQDAVGSRVTTKLRSVARGLDRAEGYVEDGESTKAASSLAAVRRNLAAAQKTAVRRIAAESDSAAATARAVERAEHQVVGSTVSLFDGQTGDVVTATATTLDAALDGRDALLAAVSALDEDGQADFDRYAKRVVADVRSETGDVADATADDELSSDATAALTAATTQLGTQATAAAALVGEDADDASDDDTSAGRQGRGPGGDCDRDRDDDSTTSTRGASASGLGSGFGFDFGRS